MLQVIWYWGEAWAFRISDITSDNYEMLKKIDHLSLDGDRHDGYYLGGQLIRYEQSGGRC